MIRSMDITYRYEYLLQAIDFFTQRFSVDQLSSYAFKFSHELLELNSCALFIKEEDNFVLKEVKNYNIKNYTIKNSSKLQNIATFYGNVILSDLESFFEEKDMNAFGINILIPLIIDDYLHGFIISEGKKNDFNEDDYIICFSLMRLINNSLENITHILDLKFKNKQLDQKIFNLFAINHSSKTLLSELDLKKLYYIATDIFSEITASKVTSFGIYDDISKTINILGYRNVCNFSKYYSKLSLYDNTYTSNKIVLNFDEDLELIKSIFINWEEFYNLNTKYIVLLVKDSILGVVTLSDSVNDSIYDESTFELIESLASFTYIALSNSLLFEEIKVKKGILEKKFNMLSKLNNLIKNINNCDSIEELCSLTLKTLNISFGIKKAFIACQHNNSYTIKDSIGINLKNNFLYPNENWEETFLGDMIYSFSKDAIFNYFDNDLINLIGDSNCIVISPISIETTFSFEVKYPIGYIVILETKDNLQEEELLLIDTVTQNISPVIHQMDSIRKLKENYIENPKKIFLNTIQEKIEDAKKYEIDFNVYYKKIEIHPFKTLDLSIYNDLDYYLIDNYLFIISYDNLQYHDFHNMGYINSIEDITNYDYK